MSVMAPARDDRSIERLQAIDGMTGTSISEFAGPSATLTVSFCVATRLTRGRGPLPMLLDLYLSVATTEPTELLPTRV
ncbi:hypothetical protein JMJ77_0003264 [Colletotrichum scovillei]|uniref:Uncharacterized protein n=1 Tax=Colletotrichum scovillei TaxID=1209932 RepID=A0A9P7QWP0_9PEZI|nr:hypothetical protein JMJ77_0003264 [Colletotrichum scovillei]